MSSQRSSDHGMRIQLPLAVLALVIIVASAASLAVQGLQEWQVAAAFAALIVVGEVVRINLP